MRLMAGFVRHITRQRAINAALLALKSTLQTATLLVAVLLCWRFIWWGIIFIALALLLRKRVLLLTVLLVAVLALSGTFRKALLGLDLMWVPSASMAPAISANSIIFVDLWAYESLQPQRCDIVLFRRGDIKMIKRIAGVPTEEITLTNQAVYLGKSVVPCFPVSQRSSELSLEGYYPSKTNRLSNKDQTLTLRKILNPIPMYAKKATIYIPKRGVKYGLDLEASDSAA